MPQTDARPFLERCAFALSWGDLSNKTVMIVGCEEDNNTTKRFIEMFPDVKRVVVIGTDVDSIIQADAENRRPNIYHYLHNIENWSHMKTFAYQIDVVVSYFAFNDVYDQVEAFRNVYKLLKSGGTAGIMFTLQSDKYDWLVEVSHLYGHYALEVNLEPPDTHKLSLSASHFKPILEKIGFQVLQCDDSYHYCQYKNRMQCKRELALLCPLTYMIPDGLLEAYLEEICHLYMKHNPMNGDGKVDFNYTSARMFLRKE